MPPRASPSKKSITAGILAGLLAAGLGTYYLRTPPVSAPQAAQQGARAAAALMALPELQAWSALIEKQSDGARHGGVIEYDPAPRLVNGKPYRQFGFIENGADMAQRWESFLVSPDGGEILIEDSASDELLSLERWRREQRPMDRARQ